MTDFDADEPVPPLPVRKTRFWTADRIIGWSGAALAMMAAFFPWYVFINEDKFGLEALRQMVSGDPAVPSRHATSETSPGGIPDRTLKAELPRSEDNIVTGTVPADTASKEDGEDIMPAQPFPAAPRNFRLLKVIKDQAMIEDATGIYVVRAGDVLPDRTKVAKLERREGKWVLVTDGGTAYSAVEN
ncbi:MAG: flagellar protein [Rhizobiaceae bacterium]|nr:flagellar protein [Rhizobiaceae bacterium]